MIKKDQKGMSLPIVMLVMAMVVANTYYFMGLIKNTSTRNAVVSANIKENAERRRLIGYLSDFEVCYDNFGTQSVASLLGPPSIGFPLKKNGIDFLQTGTNYIQQTHRLTSFYFVKDPVRPSQTAYSVVMNYDVTSASTGKTQSRITVPLYVDLSATGTIDRCYARPDEDTGLTGTKVAEAIQNACQGNSAYFKNDPTTKIITCEHATTPIDCGANRFISALTTGVTDNLLSFECNGLANTSCPSSPIQQMATGLTNSSISCATPDNGCGAGTMMIKNSSGSITCSSNCPAGFLFNSIDGLGVSTCYDRYKPCSPGTYATNIYADGHVDCAPIQFKNKYCAAGNFATDMNPQSADPFTCAPYAATKACATPGTFTFVSSLSTVVPSCTTFTN